MKRIAVVQSSYIPWKGYFDLINSVDEFVLYDDMQFTRRDWRNRNRIKTPQGVAWLTIPVEVKGRYHQRIDETVTVESDWRLRHWKTLVHSYRRAPSFDDLAPVLEPLYLASDERRLSSINRTFIEAVCDVLGVRTRLRWSTEYPATGTRTDRLVALCRAAGASHYLSGPAARAYLDERRFHESGISVSYADYDGYPEYAQLHGPFDHRVSIVDLLFTVGRDAPSYMKSFDGRSI